MVIHWGVRVRWIDLKIKVETIKNKSTQRERALEIETLGKKSGTIDVSINNRIQDRQNLRCRRFHRKHDTTIKEITKCKKMLILKIDQMVKCKGSVLI